MRRIRRGRRLIQNVQQSRIIDGWQWRLGLRAGGRGRLFLPGWILALRRSWGKRLLIAFGNISQDFDLGLFPKPADPFGGDLPDIDHHRLRTQLVAYLSSGVRRGFSYERNQVHVVLQVHPSKQGMVAAF